MAVRKLEFEDLQQPWKLAITEFGDFNLLVGLSGVGKTRTLRVLQSIGKAASGDEDHGLRHCRWNIEVETSQGVFSWKAETVPDSNIDSKIDVDEEFFRLSPSPNIRFTFEEIRRENGDIIASRDEDRLFLNEKESPKLRPADSIVSLFDEEPISTIRNALSAIHFSRTRTEGQLRPFDLPRLEKMIDEIGDIDALKKNRSLDLMSKAFVLEKKFPDHFRAVEEQLFEIFDSVEELRIGPRRDFSSIILTGPIDFLVPAFKERGVKGWIYGGNMSAGMARTLMHILEIYLEPPGSVLLIDEYENGMGVNCLSQVTELIIERSKELQLIFTSHHPFVIDTIPKNLWMVMRRNGYEVSVLRVQDIERLNTESNQDAFIQLVNAPEYMHGLQ